MIYKYFSKQFPKMFKDETGSGDDVSQYYIELRRRSPGFGEKQIFVELWSMHHKKSFSEDIPVDNCWIVPHNPHLLRIFAFQEKPRLSISPNISATDTVVLRFL